MKTKEKTILILLMALVFSCGEGSRNWKNDFIGAWKATTPHGIFYEEWKQQKDTLSGKGFEINAKGDTIFGEKLELFERGETLVYVAYPGDNRRVEFIGKRNEEGRYVFENEKNDSPSVIEYIFDNEKLQVNLKGAENGKKMNVSLHMTRQK
ncbi:MAG: hypothetical protein ACHQF2_03050 [Flavobacteriales bacterium]